MTPGSYHCAMKSGGPASGCPEEAARTQKAWRSTEIPSANGAAGAREIGRIVDEVSEASVADFLGGIFSTYPAAELMPRQRKVHRSLKARRFADVTGKSLDEIGADRCFSRAWPGAGPRPEAASWRRRPLP
jgi:hypothetical protein